MPTKKEVIFGHHFTSIAGTGPIVGPAIAIIWGWVPALLWVFVGSIIMGAVHDFGSLIISMRNQRKSIAEYTAKYINDRTRFLFFLPDCFFRIVDRCNYLWVGDCCSFQHVSRIGASGLVGRIDKIVVNKVMKKEIASEIKEEFENQKIISFPFSSNDLLGYSSLNEYIDSNRLTFNDICS